MGQLVNDVYEKIVSEGWSDGRSTFPPHREYAIEDLMDCAEKDVEVIANYHSETRRAVSQMLSVYWRNPLFQPKRRRTGVRKTEDEKRGEGSAASTSVTGTTLTSLLHRGQLSVLLLHKLSDELRFVLIVALIRRIMQARLETSELEKNFRILPNLTDAERRAMLAKIEQGLPPTWIVADEAQNFLPSERQTTATSVLVRLVREGRNFGLSFMLTTQQPSAIDQRILAQVDSLMVHKLTVQKDIDYVRQNLKSPLPSEANYGNSSLSFDDLIRILDTGQAVVSNTETDRAFVMDVRPRVSAHGGFGV